MRKISYYCYFSSSGAIFSHSRYPAISFAIPLGLRPVLPYRIPPWYILSLLTLLFFPSSRASEPASLPPPPPSPSLFRVTHLLYPYPSPSLGLSLATHKPLPPDCRRSRLPRPPPPVPPSPSPSRSPPPSPQPSSPRAFLLFLFRLFLSLVKSISHSACSLHWQRGTLPDFLSDRIPFSFSFFFLFFPPPRECNLSAKRGSDCEEKKAFISRTIRIIIRFLTLFLSRE